MPLTTSMMCLSQMMMVHHIDVCEKSNTLRGVVFFQRFYIFKQHSILTYTVYPAAQGIHKSPKPTGYSRYYYRYSRLLKVTHDYIFKHHSISMSTQHTNGERALLVPITTTEAHGILCAAMFIDYNTIHNGRDNEILVAALNGEMDTALRLAVIKLANYKINAECHDTPDVIDNLDTLIRRERGTGASIFEDVFGGPQSSEDTWDGDETDRIMH